MTGYSCSVKWLPQFNMLLAGIQLLFGHAKHEEVPTQPKIPEGDGAYSPVMLHC